MASPARPFRGQKRPEGGEIPVCACGIPVSMRVTKKDDTNQGRWCARPAARPALPLTHRCAGSSPVRPARASSSSGVTAKARRAARPERSARRGDGARARAFPQTQFLSPARRHCAAQRAARVRRRALRRDRHWAGRWGLGRESPLRPALFPASRLLVSSQPSRPTAPAPHSPRTNPRQPARPTWCI